MNTIKIGNKIIGKTQPLYFIADIGANHNGSLENAYKLIELAKESGADAAKFQNFKANKIVSKYGFENLGGQLTHQASWKKSVFEIYEDASISMDWTSKLKDKCNEVGIDYFTSPYDIDSVDHVDPFVDVYKIGSGDITWIEIIEYIAKKGKPVFLATGASEMPDVERAMEAIGKYTNEIVLMQCNTNYTIEESKIKYVNLNVLKTYQQKYPSVVLGLSDHTLGHSTVLGSIALGAVVFEKHFTDDNANEGPDHKFAMNPETWKAMVKGGYELHSALGDGFKRVEENEKQSLVVQQRCLRATKNLAKGHIITENDLEALRPIPEGGIKPYELEKVIGKMIVTDLEQGKHLAWQDIK
ncbi:MAG: N-acetylneuraminate synthase family protein [Ferruginibacter sp.]